MTNPNLDRWASRFLADQEELAERIARAVPRDGRTQPQPGLFFIRASSPSDQIHSMLEPSLCVIGQGSKDVFVGADRLRYDAAHYLIITMGVPAVIRVVEASLQRPYLGFRLVLDPSIVNSMILESGLAQPYHDGGSVKAVAVDAIGAKLLDAILRLVRLIDSPVEYRILAPLIVREIIFHLLSSSQNSRLHHLATFGGLGHRMLRAVQHLRDNFDKPLRMEAIAKELGMSLSGFHTHFKAVTALSPLQFQKQLRLQEARRLMLGENLDASETAFRVGYDDASHFSREYKRHFGEPPIRDVERLRKMSAT
jgi:AraC-like DNA-binding protein